MDGAESVVSGAVDAILGFFDFDWHLPELKLPHIVVGEYIDVPVLGRIPNPTTLRVDWYATGGVFDTASVIGVGEAGPEVQAAADYVTASVDDDGIRKALIRFGVIGSEN